MARDIFSHIDSSTCESGHILIQSWVRQFGVSSGSPIVAPPSSTGAGSDENFQKLLLRIPRQRRRANLTPGALLELFCRAVRESFQLSGVYFWRCHPGDELVGEHASGKIADRFIGIRIRPDDSAVTAEAVRQRRTLFLITWIRWSTHQQWSLTHGPFWLRQS